jgi:hypothetical protein
MIAQKDCVLKLPNKMTDEQIIARAKQLAHALQTRQKNIDKIEEAKLDLKQVKLQCESNLETVDKEIYSIQIDLNHNHIISDVACVEIKNFDTGVCYYRRADNNEIVPGKFRKMTENELSQLPLNESKLHITTADIHDADILALKAFLISLSERFHSRSQHESIQPIVALLESRSAFDDTTKKCVTDAEFKIISDNSETGIEEDSNHAEAQTAAAGSMGNSDGKPDIASTYSPGPEGIAQAQPA